MDRWLILGLGNPGARYQGTRHNVGFAVAESISALGGRRLRRPHLFGLLGSYRFARLSPIRLDVAEPLTYMNRSGTVIPELLKRCDIPTERLLVVTDNLDLPPGTTRLKRRGGAATHNGLKSVSRVLGTDNYPRLYIGIGHPGASEHVVDHVLSRAQGQEATALEGGISRAAETLLRLPDIGFDQAINELNKKG